MSWMRNPHAMPIKKYMYDLLKDRYAKHEAIIDRIVYWLQTREDMERWSELMADLYELGFLKAVGEYREQMESRGFRVDVVPEKQKTNAPSIFPQEGSEKSG